jgi:hypothetical protein
MVSFSLGERYWEDFQLQEEDIEFLYNRLLELETPLTSRELVSLLVEERIRREVESIEEQRRSGAEVYLPKNRYTLDQKLVFPALEWQRGKVVGVREGRNPDLPAFEVIRVCFDSGEEREFASGLEEHALNTPSEVSWQDPSLDSRYVLFHYGDLLEERLEQGLRSNQGFVRIAGRWFPRSLLLEINAGHLNLAEAVLDMAGGGPLSTQSLLQQIELPTSANPKLVEFSLDLALQEDARFDEVGPAGEVLWFLRRLEPEQVREVPLQLRYQEIEYDRSRLTKEMLALERELDDELSPVEPRQWADAEVVIRLIYPHWRVGTLPISSRNRHLFPTAYEAPRIRFTFVEQESNERFPAWVVRDKCYVFGLRQWYQKRGLIPGSLVRLKRGKKPGEVIVSCDSQRASREWIRTLLIGSDGGIVFAMLKHIITAAYDERMAIAIPDVEALDGVWQNAHKDRRPFEAVVLDILRKLAELNPQGHVHASELYAAINTIRRCPPGPILALLASQPHFTHVGDLHFRIEGTE